MVNDTTSTLDLMKTDVITKDDLVMHFKDIGIQKGMVVYVQSAMEYYSFVCGGNRVIVEALQEVIGYEGTIVASSFTTQNVDPFDINERIIEPYKVDVIREAMPAFHKKLSQSDHVFARQMMLHDGVYRSNHPTHSFIAWGKYAKLICDRQPLHFALSNDSPFSKLCELNAYVLLLGVKCTDAEIFMHTVRNNDKTPIKIVSSPIERKGKKSFLHMLEYQNYDADLRSVVEMMEERAIINETYIGRAKCRFFSAKEATTLASAYFMTHGGK